MPAISQRCCIMRACSKIEQLSLARSLSLSLSLSFSLPLSLSFCLGPHAHFVHVQDMVHSMKVGSVTVDLAAATGGNIATTRADEVRREPTHPGGAGR